MSGQGTNGNLHIANQIAFDKCTKSSYKIEVCINVYHKTTDASGMGETNTESNTVRI